MEQENFSFDKSFDKNEPFERWQQGLERSKRLKVLNEKDPDMKLYVLLTICLIILGMLVDNDFISRTRKVF